MSLLYHIIFHTLSSNLFSLYFFQHFSLDFPRAGMGLNWVLQWMCSYDGGSTLPYTASSNLLMKPPKGDLTTAMRAYKHSFRFFLLLHLLILPVVCHQDVCCFSLTVYIKQITILPYLCAKHSMVRRTIPGKEYSSNYEFTSFVLGNFFHMVYSLLLIHLLLMFILIRDLLPLRLIQLIFRHYPLHFLACIHLVCLGTYHLSIIMCRVLFQSWIPSWQNCPILIF